MSKVVFFCVTTFFMKQAFTNTTNVKTKGKPLHLKSRDNQKMPLCRYGAACVFQKTCIYRHENIGEHRSSKICVAYIAGKCTFGKNCNNRHLSEQDIGLYKRKMNKIPCKFGSQCKTEDCLYSHPAQIESCLNVFATEFIPKTKKTTFDNIPTYSMKEKNQMIPKTVKPCNLKKRIPDSLWVNDFERPSNLFFIKDPMEKFAAVNQVYSNQRFVKAFKSLKVRVVDLHFQTISGCKKVLTAVIPRLQTIDKSQIVGVWIITGTGHHVVKRSHQKKDINGVSVLMATTKEYLSLQGLSYEVGVDNSGQSGAIYVPLV